MVRPSLLLGGTRTCLAIREAAWLLQPSLGGQRHGGELGSAPGYLQMVKWPGNWRGPWSKANGGRCPSQRRTEGREGAGGSGAEVPARPRRRLASAHSRLVNFLALGYFLLLVPTASGAISGSSLRANPPRSPAGIWLSWPLLLPRVSLSSHPTSSPTSCFPLQPFDAIPRTAAFENVSQAM